jgi:N-terminal acetyltransferase B complex catalytic subunit
MTTIRRFTMDDLLKFNNVNFDRLTETFSTAFYFNYMAQWPEAFNAVEAPNGNLMGYIIGKVEGTGNLWHGHVSAVTVAPVYRRMGLARMLMQDFEETCANVHDAYFVDLFVRASNTLAISMYEKLGYIQYRRVLGYYSGDADDDSRSEDAWDMRRALPRDKDRLSVIPLDHPVHPEDLEW